MKNIILKIIIIAIIISVLPVDFLSLSNKNTGIYLQAQTLPTMYEYGQVRGDGTIFVRSPKYPNGATYFPPNSKITYPGFENTPNPNGKLLIGNVDDKGDITYVDSGVTDPKAVAERDLGNLQPNPPETPNSQIQNQNEGFFQTINSLGARVANLPNEIISTIVNTISMMILSLASLILGLATLIFDYAISFSIQNFNAMVDAIFDGNSFDAVWTEITKLVSMMFIGILIYVSIGTILQLNSIAGNTKKLVVNIIILALLVNFSMFFTKMIIDVSNMAAVGLYNKTGQIVSNAGGCDIALVSIKNFNIKPGCIPGYFFDLLGMQGIFSPADASFSQHLTDAGKQLIRSLILSGIMWFMAFVFFIGAVLFIVRSISFVILVVLSPIAFASMAIPKTKQMIYDKWWKNLIENAIFAPTFMFMIWITISMLDPLFGSIGASWNNSVNEVLGSGGNYQDFLKLALNYIIVMTMLVMTIIISKSAGIYGTKTVTDSIYKFGKSIPKSAVGAAARGTVGKASRASNEELSNRAFGYTRVGSALRNITDKGQNAKFGTKKSAVERSKELDKRDLKYEEKKFIEPEFKKQQSQYKVQKEEKEKTIKTAEERVEYTENEIKKYDKETNNKRLPFETEINKSKENIINLKERLSKINKNAPLSGEAEKDINKQIEQENIKMEKATFSLQKYNREREAGKKGLEDSLQENKSDLAEAKSELKTLEENEPKIENVRATHADTLSKASRLSSVVPILQKNYRSGITYSRRQELAKIMRDKELYQKKTGVSDKDKMAAIKKMLDETEGKKGDKPKE